MAHEHLLPWARKVDAALQKLDRIPLAGNAPAFDLARISSQIASHFSAPSFSLELGEASWKSASKITEGLGTNRIALGIALTPLMGQAVWIMTREDVAHLTSWMMNGNARGRTITSEILQEGFYRYLALSTLDALQDLEPLKQFTLRLDEEPHDGSEASYCLDIKLCYENRTAWGRLVVSHSLLSSWQRHFASINEIFALTALGRSIEVAIGVRTGSVMLSAKEWKKLNPGDFVLLERGSYDPRHKTGIASLVLGDTPLFHVSIKENKIKLLDHALFYEEDMNQNDPGPQEAGAEELIPADEGRSMAVKDLPLFVTVELARLRMTVDQIMKLAPGNLLELPIHPDQGVILTVNGQKVGRAELVTLGESLGIRILETAKG